MRGAKTAAKLEAEFRRLYIKYGNASEAARQLGLPVYTGCKLARDARNDPKFAKKVEAIYAHALDNVELVMLDGIEQAAKLLASGPKTIEGIAEMMDAYKLRSFQDPRPQYLAQVVNGHRSLLARQKQLEEAGGLSEPSKLEIVFTDVEPAAKAGAESTAESSTQADPAKADDGSSVGPRSR
jgi:hypothetical protein